MNPHGRRTRASWYLASLAMVLPVICPGQSSPQYTITNFAGNGSAGFSGDSGAATDAQLNYPQAVARDSSGNLFIADCFNHRIRKVDSSGSISTVAGSGTAGATGDGSGATSAQLYNPCGVAVDGSGTIYIADTHNHEVRKVTGSTISKVAGIGEAAYGGDGAVATDSGLNSPLSVALGSSGVIYIADTANNRVRKVEGNGNISTAVGNGSAGYSGDGGAATSAAIAYPQGLAVDGAGNLYISDTLNHVIRKVTTDGTISTVAGTGTPGFSGDNGPATSARLSYPKGVAVDSSGNLYIADTFNSRIRRVDANTGNITTIAGVGRFGDRGDGGPATAAWLRFPSGVAVDSSTGNVYVVDDQNSKIRLLTPVTSTIIPGAIPAIESVISSAAFGSLSSVAPGSWIEIYGSNLAPSSREWTAADFVNGEPPVSLDGTRVTIGGQDAFVAYVSPNQVNALVPQGVGFGNQQIRVTSGAGESAAYEVAVKAAEPGLLAPNTLKIGGRQYVAAILPEGGAYALPSGRLANSASRPAHAGETITLYGVGFGAVSSGQTVDLPVQVFFGQTQADVSYAGLAPGSIGLYQLSVVVPNIAAGEAVPLKLNVGGVSGQQDLVVAIEN